MARSVEQLMRVDPNRLPQAARLRHLRRLAKVNARLAAQIQRTIASASDPR